MLRSHDENLMSCQVWVGRTCSYFSLHAKWRIQQTGLNPFQISSGSAVAQAWYVRKQKKCIEKSQHRCLTSKSKLQKSVWPCEGFPPLSAWATAPREGFCQTIKDYVQLQGVFSKCFKAFQEFSSHLHQPFRFLIFCVFFVPKLEQWHKKPGTPRTPEHWKKTYYQGMAKTISMSFK